MHAHDIHVHMYMYMCDWIIHVTVVTWEIVILTYACSLSLP